MSSLRMNFCSLLSCSAFLNCCKSSLSAREASAISLVVPLMRKSDETPKAAAILERISPEGLTPLLWFVDRNSVAVL